MNKNEEAFGKILLDAGVEFVPQYAIKIRGIVKARVDFFLPKEELYCEVISSRQAFASRCKKLACLIKSGYEFVFYRHTGERIIFTEWQIAQLGLHHNLQLSSIPELEVKLCATSGKFFSKRPYFGVI